jgi:ribonuclease HI
MELMAVIEAIKTLTREGLTINIFSDSSYVVNAVEKGWLKNWIRIGFKDKKNPDLWKEYAQVAAKHHIKFTWVKGHADNPLNNRCDELATAAADRGPHAVDHGFESAQ